MSASGARKGHINLCYVTLSISQFSIDLFARKLCKKTEEVNCLKSYRKIIMEDIIELMAGVYLQTSEVHCNTALLHSLRIQGDHIL